MRSLGYEASPTDPCVMRKIVGDEVYLLVIITFAQKFQWITMEISDLWEFMSPAGKDIFTVDKSAATLQEME